MEWINIFKRNKTVPPVDSFSNNWKQDQFEKNIEVGSLSLLKGKGVKILDDGRGYELALEIKKKYLLEYVKALSEKIDITISGNTIEVKLKVDK